ncbi:MAG TPA: diacylglycerol kinase family protein [Amaricoccus sp.]|nr:diacylglycerol kinase family protein [Amaricoccus sp.]
MTAGTTDSGAGSAGGDIRVILNARSGKRSGRAQVEELAALFERYPGRFSLRVVRGGRMIARETARAIEEGVPTIVAAGGDGTICGIAAQLAGTGARLGVLPLGTFNYFARSLDLPEDLEAAVRVLAEGQERAIPVGEVNGQVFLNNASLGAYAAILFRRERVYRRWGRSRIAAYWSVLTTLLRFRSSLDVAITVDGATRAFRTPLVFVAKNAFQLELFELDGADRVRSGDFAVFVAPDCSRLDLLRTALRLAFRSLQPSRDFELICGRDVRVEMRHRRRLVARDGERERMTGPFRFAMRPEALRVIVPAGPG